MSDDDSTTATSIAALRGQVATLLRTEARLYQSQAANDRQLALFEKLHDLGIRLIGADEVSKIGASAAEFATQHLRYDAALVLVSAGDDRRCTVIGFDGLDRQQLAAVERLAISPAHPLVALAFTAGVLDYPLAGEDVPELARFADAVGLPAFTAYTLSSTSGPRGLLLAGSTGGNPIVDDVSRRGLANLSTLCAATFDATVSRREIVRDRESLAKRVEERTRDLTTALEEVTRLSRTDSLTELPNRRAVMEHAEKALLLARRHGRAFALISVDIDQFKSINDALGHHAGDAVLAAVSRLLRASVRDSDLVGRIGGEEFMIVLSETTVPSVVEIGERCRRALHLADWAAVSPVLTSVTASFGIAIYPDHASDLVALLQRADEALYRAKHQGRDAVVVFRDEARPAD